MNTQSTAQTSDIDGAWNRALSRLRAARDAVAQHGCFVENLGPAAHLADTMELYVSNKKVDYPWQHVPVTPALRPAPAPPEPSASNAATTGPNASAKARAKRGALSLRKRALVNATDAAATASKRRAT